MNRYLVASLISGITLLTAFGTGLANQVVGWLEGSANPGEVAAELTNQDPVEQAGQLLQRQNPGAAAVGQSVPTSPNNVNVPTTQPNTTNQTTPVPGGGTGAGAGGGAGGGTGGGSSTQPGATPAPPREDPSLESIPALW